MSENDRSDAAASLPNANGPSAEPSAAGQILSAVGQYSTASSSDPAEPSTDRTVSTADPAGSNRADAAADEFARPAGVGTSFAPHDPMPPSPGPRQDPPPGAEAYAAPGGSDVSFAPAERRLEPSSRVSAAAVTRELHGAFGRPGTERDGFDVPPGERIDPGAREAESPWWKSDAGRDPWRDDGSSSWLGRPAVYVDEQPTAFAEDAPSEDFEPPVDTTKDEPSGVTVVNGRIGPKLLLLSLVAVLLAGGIGGGLGYWLTRSTNDRLHDPDIKLAAVSTPLTRPPGSVASIAKRISPSVVQIDVRGATEAGTGSGVVISKLGYILTNNHVVSVAAAKGGSIRVVFSDETIEAATLVGRDPTTDLAVIKVTHSPLTVATLGQSNSLAVGDPVIAIGSPLGLQGTVTTGIVSALDRAVHVDGDGSDTNAVIDAIQTDAAINPGNSGGALVNSSGAVVGIPSAIASLGTTAGTQSGSIGLGFAIPIDEARDIATQLIKTGKAVHASIGLTTRSVTDGVRLGAYILQVNPEGPAAKAGLKAGDVVKLADSHLIETADDLTLVVGRHKPGDKIAIRYVRGATEHNTTITLGTDS